MKRLTEHHSRHKESEICPPTDGRRARERVQESAAGEQAERLHQYPQPAWLFLLLLVGGSHGRAANRLLERFGAAVVDGVVVPFLVVAAAPAAAVVVFVVEAGGE